MDCDCPACGTRCVHTKTMLKCPKCGHVVNTVPFEELAKKYPHAATHITEEGLLRADKQTLETWEWEAQQCDHVTEAIDSEACPRCGGKLWKMGDVLVNFYFPFVHSMRVQVPSLLGMKSKDARDVTCVTCGLKRRLK